MISPTDVKQKAQWFSESQLSKIGTDFYYIK